MTCLASGSVAYMSRSSAAILNPSVYFSCSSRHAYRGVSRPITNGGIALATLSPTE